jgi:hypothetical protein
MRPRRGQSARSVGLEAVEDHHVEGETGVDLEDGSLNGSREFDEAHFHFRDPQLGGG